MPHKDILFESLSRALQSIQLWLSRNGASRLMVAAPTIAAMKCQELPDHVSMTPQKRRGLQEKVSSAHFRGRITLAGWPEDGLCEYSIPILACVINGQADMLIADYVLHCQAGDAIFFPAGIPKCSSAKPHIVGDTRGRSCDVMWINLVPPAKGLSCSICHSRGSEHLPFQDGDDCIAQNFFLERLFEGLCEELQKRGSGKMAVEVLSLIVGLLQRDIDEGAMLPPPYSRIPAHTVVGESLDPIGQACSYIDSHLELPLTIKIVARQACLSPTIFTRRFREQKGQSFHEYLTAQRLKKAVSLLCETNMMVHQVSDYVGINPSRLRDLFHERHGCSPAEFRRQYLSS